MDSKEDWNEPEKDEDEEKEEIHNFTLTKRQRTLICYLLNVLNITPEQIIAFIKRTYQTEQEMKEDSIKKNIIRLKEYSFKYDSTTQYNYFDLFNNFFQNYFKYSKYNNIKDGMIRNVSQQISTIYSADIFADETVEKKFIDKSIDCIYQILYSEGNTITLTSIDHQFTDSPKYFYLVYYLCVINNKKRDSSDGQTTEGVALIENMWQFLYDLLPEKMEAILQLEYFKECIEILNMPPERQHLFIKTGETLFNLYCNEIYPIDNFDQALFKNIIDFQTAATKSLFQENMQKVIFDKKESFATAYKAGYEIYNFQQVVEKHFAAFLDYNGTNEKNVNKTNAAMDYNSIQKLSHVMVMMSRTCIDYFECLLYLFCTDEYMCSDHNAKLEILKNYYLLHLLDKEKLLINRMKGRTGIRKKKEENTHK